MIQCYRDNVTTAVDIVWRAENGWPYNAVDYSQSQIWNDDDGSGPHIGLYRKDCSGFASMAAGLTTAGGGLSTVTFLTTGAVRLITWAELAPGDFVGALGAGTAGNAGHIMVVESVNHAAGTYTVLEQAGYGPGPDRNTYKLRDGQGRNYLPYRLSTLEDDMAISNDDLQAIAALTAERTVLLLAKGVDDRGEWGKDSIVTDHLPGLTIADVLKRIDGLAARLGDAPIEPGTTDPELAPLIAAAGTALTALAAKLDAH